MDQLKAIQALTRSKVEEASKLVRTGCATCPAALMHSASVECRIESQHLHPEGDPSSIINLCIGEYEKCPSWRLNKTSALTAPQFAAAARRVVAKREDKDNEFLQDFNERFGGIQ